MIFQKAAPLHSVKYSSESILILVDLHDICLHTCIKLLIFDCLRPFAVPGPPSLWVRPGSGPSVVVRWAPPLECSESGFDSQRAPLEIQGYRLQFGLKNTSLSTTVDFTKREKNFTVRNLSPGSSYIFVLSAKSRAGYGDVAKQEITVPMFPPLGYPKISDYVNTTCCSLHFSWAPPSPEECNDIITEFTVAYREVAAPKPSAEPGPSASPQLPALPWLVTVPASESSYTILGLNHSTIYMVQLRAHNKAGPGPFSPPVLSRTLAFETGRTGLRTPPPQQQFCLIYFTLKHFPNTRPVLPSQDVTPTPQRGLKLYGPREHSYSPPVSSTPSLIPSSPPLHHRWERAEC